MQFVVSRFDVYIISHLDIFVKGVKQKNSYGLHRTNVRDKRIYSAEVKKLHPSIPKTSRKAFEKRFGEKLFLKSFSPIKFNYFSLFPETILTRANMAMALGMTMSWLNMSVSSQTRSLERTEPRKMKTRAMME